MSPAKPLYYAVIFTSELAPSHPGYAEMAEQMLQAVGAMPGFLGFDSARDANNRGITVSYWENLESVRAWKQLPRHLAAQATGRQEWYLSYRIRVAEVIEDRGEQR